MDIAIFFLKSTLLIVIDVLQIAMLIRALFSWFDPMKESKISNFLFVLTEPVILPFRRLCERMHWFEGSFLDMPFLFAVLLLSLLQFSLSVL